VSGVDVNNLQAVNATPILLDESALSKQPLWCARVPVSGLSRLKLGSYSSIRRVTLVPSDTIPEKAYKKIHICFHSNSSLGLCKCEIDLWESVQSDGVWTSVISPYENRFVDVKFVENLSGYVTLTTDLEFQRWRLVCLAIGLGLLLLAPIISSWVPFYYSSSMVIGVCLVVIILLFQGMKLLPTGRKNALYSTICGLALGAGSFLLNRFSMFVNSILINFGISEEMHNPVLIFFLVGIALAGAGFGYWLVRKFVVADDGSVDVSVSEFVKWALRVIAVTFIFQSTVDVPLAVLLLASVTLIYFCISHSESTTLGQVQKFRISPLKRRTPRSNTVKPRAEFLKRSGGGGSLWRTPTTNRRSSSPLWPNSPVGRAPAMESYYSSFHRTPQGGKRKKFTGEEWKEFTEESTLRAVAELTASPDFADWVVKNSDRIRINPEPSSEESIGSDDSNDEQVALS
ncbi:hypothetical protein M569_12979, partial [Genlisea aurea]